MSIFLIYPISGFSIGCPSTRGFTYAFSQQNASRPVTTDHDGPLGHPSR
jgi:hypothetical protein